MITLSARDAYPRWASTYDSETVVSDLERMVLSEMGIVTRDRSLLDVGCGTARRFAELDARVAIGVDLAPAMLSQAQHGLSLAAADVRALPFADATFDVLWCRLVLGHLPEIGEAFAELGRVSAPDARVVISDLAPSAYEAGHRRTFKSPGGETIEIEHFVHDADAMIAAAACAGLRLCGYRTGVVGAAVREHYVRADALELYARQVGEVLVHTFTFGRM